VWTVGVVMRLRAMGGMGRAVMDEDEKPVDDSGVQCAFGLCLVHGRYSKSSTLRKTARRSYEKRSSRYDQLLFREPMHWF